MNASAGGAAFEVRPYTGAALEELLCNPHVELDRIRGKLQVDFLKGYLTEIGAKTIIVELDYVDRDYLEDFAAYYVLCFVQYERRCKRLHFFSETFSHADLTEFLRTRNGSVNADNLSAAYLGFM